MKAAELGFKLKPEMPEVKTITMRVKELENQGYEYEAAEGSLALPHRQDAQNIASPRFTWTPITFPCAATPRNPSVKQQCACVSVKKFTMKSPKATGQ